MADTFSPLHFQMFDGGGSVVNLGNSGLNMPTDGTTPIDTAVQAALARIANAGGGVLRIPPGSYVVDSVDLDATPAPVLLDLRGVTLTKASVAQGGTVAHMFRSEDGALEGLRIRGGIIDVLKAEWTAGSAVSAFYGVRVDDWGFYGTRFRSGVQAAIDLIMPRQVRVDWCAFTDFLDQGVHLNVPASIAAGTKPDRAIQDIVVSRSRFTSIDDGTLGTGDGNGVELSSANFNHGARGVRVESSYFEGCIRGIYGNFSNASECEGLSIEGNTLHRSRLQGVGLVGVKGRVAGNHMTDLGEFVPSGGAIVAGVYVDGGSVLVDGNAIEENRTGTGLTDPDTDSFMEYGIYLEAGSGHNVRSSNRIEGARKKRIHVEAAITDSSIEYPNGGARVAARPVSAITVPSGWTYASLLTLQSEYYNTVNDGGGAEESLHFTTTVQWRFTATTPGLWEVLGSVVWEQSDIGTRGVRVTRVPAEVLYESIVDPAQTQETAQAIAASLELAVGDIIQIEVAQDSGSNLDLAFDARSTITVKQVAGGPA